MINEGTLLDIIRLFIGIIILSYASYTDIKTRMASNLLWVIMGSAGIVLFAIQFFITPFIDPYSVLLVFFITVAFIYGFTYMAYKLRLLTGGADLKAFWVLTLLVPLEPAILGYPIIESYMPFPWVIFTNSVLIVLILPVSLFIYNLTKKNLDFPYCLFGYKMSVKKAKTKFVWPLERYVNGKRKMYIRPKKFDIKEELEEFEKKNIKEIWVQPKLPFMINILAGFIISFIIGDLLTAFVNLIF